MPALPPACGWGRAASPAHLTWAPAGQNQAGSDPRRALLSQGGLPTAGSLRWRRFGARCRGRGRCGRGTGCCQPGSACSRCPTSPAASRCKTGLELQPHQCFFPPFPPSLSPLSLRARSVRFSPCLVLIIGTFLLSNGSFPERLMGAGLNAATVPLLIEAELPGLALLNPPADCAIFTPRNN